MILATLEIKAYILGSLNSDALLISAKSSKCKSQLVHQKSKVKYPSLNPWQVSSVRKAWEFKTRWVTRGVLGSQVQLPLEVTDALSLLYSHHPHPCLVPPFPRTWDPTVQGRPCAPIHTFRIDSEVLLDDSNVFHISNHWSWRHE